MRPSETAESFVDTTIPAPRELPARTMQVPSTVSPQIQKIVGEPISATWTVLPKSADEWKELVKVGAELAVSRLPAIRDQLRVKSEATVIDGVKAHILTPEEIPPENRNRLLIHIHGGCYVNNPGESGTTEGVMMAGFGRFTVISVDYRMAPDHVFPAALDDVIAVWKAAQAMASPKNMAVFGSSAGGALTLSMVLRARQDTLPLPAAIAPGTPMSDLTNVGDSFQTNELIDNVLISANAGCTARAAMYANGHDLTDPLLSPLFGDMHGFPPTFLTTGTRDLLLSSTVRVHQKMRRAGVEAILYVHEGMPHGGWNRDISAPETKEGFRELSQFFDLHLAK
jgi:monoterpene epsilon-lactone hydrolase